ncbi:unnamed protein product [Pylaiella littoralis]
MLRANLRWSVDKGKAADRFTLERRQGQVVGQFTLERRQGQAADRFTLERRQGQVVGQFTLERRQGQIADRFTLERRQVCPMSSRLADFPFLCEVSKVRMSHGSVGYAKEGEECRKRLL